VGKAVKNFLFFSDLAVRYVRFWLIFLPRRHKDTKRHKTHKRLTAENAEIAEVFSQVGVLGRICL